MRRATQPRKTEVPGAIISIHALLAESDNTADQEARKRLISIHALLAESDHLLIIYDTLRKNFYPRSPCGERHETTPCRVSQTQISIHALLAESDVEKVPADVYYQAFLSTLSLRRATVRLYRLPLIALPISIHALLAESDHLSISIIKLIKYFYPRSPCGERPEDWLNAGVLPRISIHALLAESDSVTGSKINPLL